MPSSSNISYDVRTGEVAWNIGEIAPQTSKTTTIQFTFTPLASQVGQFPQLVGQTIFEGFDRFVQETIQATAGAQSTAIYDDPAYTGTQGVVTN
jgi:hypothetical protein